MPPTRIRIAVIGCGQGELCIALALARPDHVVAGFDADPAALAVARRTAARCRVADRTTFEATSPGGLLGKGYDMVIFAGRCHENGCIVPDPVTATLDPPGAVTKTGTSSPIP